MPQHKSAKKRVRTNAKRRELNRAYKTRLKNVIKNVRETKDKESAEKSFQTATAVIDKVAAKGIIHKNKAANQKSKLAKFINKLATAEKKS
jgi:small subunit ribosomal protein S20